MKVILSIFITLIVWMNDDIENNMIIHNTGRINKRRNHAVHAYVSNNFINPSLSFSTIRQLQRHTMIAKTQSKQVYSTTSNAATTTASTSSSSSSAKVPTTWDEMIRQAAACSKQATNDGITNQMIRVLLPRDINSGDFGIYRELSMKDDNMSDSNVQLVPPDESWQGGIMQLYRAALPTAKELVRQICAGQAKNNLISRIQEDRSVDDSGVDGVSLLYTEDQSIKCWIQPSQENVEQFIQQASDANQYNSNNNNQQQQQRSPPKIVILFNPQWRQVDDILDSASQNSNANPFWKGLANFLGGKGAVLQQCYEVGYRPIYALEGYVCRGSNIRLLQLYEGSNNENDKKKTTWTVFCERDTDDRSYIKIGTTGGIRPTYQDVERMMTESNIGYKYARDIGLQPKL